jgi:hypothetical protein
MVLSIISIRFFKFWSCSPYSASLINVFSRVGAELVPECILVSSGAVEIGRLDYIKRNAGTVGVLCVIQIYISKRAKGTIHSFYDLFYPTKFCGYCIIIG